MTVGYSVITISRQYGSGGREIEAQLAERLGIPFYDKTLCAEAAKHSRLDADFLEQAEKALWAAPPRKRRLRLTSRFR